MKVSDVIIYIMKIMRRALKKFVRVVSEIKIKILNEVALFQVVRKRVSFQDTYIHTYIHTYTHTHIHTLY